MNFSGITPFSSIDGTINKPLRFLSFVAVTVLLGACSGDGTSDNDAEAVKSFILSTKFQGDERVLSVVENDGGTPEILLSGADGSDTQKWLITEQENGGFSISNVSIGTTQSIDVVNDGVADKIHLADTGVAGGQIWSITSLGNSYCRLTNNFTGSEIALDIRNDDNDNEPMLAAAGDFSGQQWRIVNSDGSIATTLPMSQCSGVE